VSDNEQNRRDGSVMNVAATSVDALAVAVGSTHAMRERRAVLDLERVQRLRAAVPVPLVLHGSSRVAGPQLAEVVSHGMVKINVGTLLNIAFTEAIRPLVADAAIVDPGAAARRPAPPAQRRSHISPSAAAGDSMQSAT
jgi:fructose-bisphosphate aldolase, class II